MASFIDVLQFDFGCTIVDQSTVAPTRKVAESKASRDAAIIIATRKEEAHASDETRNKVIQSMISFISTETHEAPGDTGNFSIQAFKDIHFWVQGIERNYITTKVT